MVSILNNFLLAVRMYITVKNHNAIFMNKDERHG
jgi:hypothetical protein